MSYLLPRASKKLRTFLGYGARIANTRTYGNSEYGIQFHPCMAWPATIEGGVSVGDTYGVDAANTSLTVTGFSVVASAPGSPSSTSRRALALMVTFM